MTVYCSATLKIMPGALSLLQCIIRQKALLCPQLSLSTHLLFKVFTQAKVGTNNVNILYYFSKHLTLFRKKNSSNTVKICSSYNYNIKNINIKNIFIYVSNKHACVSMNLVEIFTNDLYFS